jgi:hypothetical protein
MQLNPYLTYNGNCEPTWAVVSVEPSRCCTVR